ncbi:ABC transporter permease [Actinomadura montaniterrae]|uniref:ABC transporter permease n=1 Tax=Actinomadura montaniterrae TaxID=1803903 RepID=A0A6L3VZH1_9ACTN|nr:ABC transporter permease [Actinomadura montaniterrae]KAB2381585.1 ABC transporter permease [Actinomadura montaniterrae]
MTAYLRLELRRLARDGGYLMASLVVPVVIYLFLGHGSHGDLVQNLVGTAGFGALGVVVTNGTSIAEDRSRGWLRLLRLTPLSPLDVVVARGLCAMVLAVLPIALISLLGAFYKHVPLGAGEWVAVLLALWFGIAPLALLGLSVGYLCEARMAQVVGTLVYVGLSLLGGLFLGLDSFPGWLQALAKFNPVYGYGEFTRRVGEGGAPPALATFVLLAWTAAFAALAAFAYRRSGRYS